MPAVIFADHCYVLGPTTQVSVLSVARNTQKGCVRLSRHLVCMDRINANEKNGLAVCI